MVRQTRRGGRRKSRKGGRTRRTRRGGSMIKHYFIMHLKKLYQVIYFIKQ